MNRWAVSWLERVSRTWLALLLAVGVAAGAWGWKQQDARIPVGDEARHLLAALRVSRGEALWSPDPGQTYPPLGYWVLALAGGDPEGVALPQGLWLAGLVWALALAARELAQVERGPGRGYDVAGPLAALFVGGSPLVQVVLRTGYVDLGLATCCAWSLLWLIRSRGFGRAGPAFMAGASAGLAALVKFAFSLFLALPALAVLLGWPGRAPSPSRWSGAGISLLGFALVAGPWYLSAPTIFVRMGQFLGGTTYTPSPGPPGSLEAWTWLARITFDWLFGGPQAGLALVAALGALWWRDRVLLGLLLFGSGPLVALAFLPHRGPHYALPALSPLALLVGLAWARALGRLPSVLAGGVGLGAAMVLIGAWGWVGSPWRAGAERGQLDPLLGAFSFGPTPPAALEPGWVLGPPLDVRARPLGQLIGELARRVEPLSPGAAPLFAQKGREPGATVLVARGLPVEMDLEALRHEAARQGASLRFGLLGPELDLGDGWLALWPGGEPPPPGFLEAARFGFPAGEVVVLASERGSAPAPDLPPVRAW